ncbi:MULTISPECIES: RcnB family protein [unclassified Brevundimonas]|uniref:RcnB family protein n=1 Tax=unclassified Brevundimonas TaxID=2622653 RepID=UPI0025B82A2D|nr:MULTISPECIES: RcnB family protein [unclassified Brevundimonas]
MKRTLLTFTAITSLLLPLATPVVAAAQDSAVQRRVEQAQRQLDRATANEQRSEPRREQRPQAQPPRDDNRRQERRRPPVPGTDQALREGERPIRAESRVQRRVEEAQRQLDLDLRQRDNRIEDRDRDRNNRWNDRNRERDRDRANQNRDRNNNRWDSRGHNRRDNYRDWQRRWDAQQWRRDFERNRRADWWRHDNRFRSWSGVRIGYYFAPGYGYYSVPRSYWNRHWQVGQFLPDVFWRYQVNDYRTYGLGYPPPGTRWVYVDNSIYLIDEYDGYIVEVIRDAWRW